jgi:N,N'-diacetyllegionaminate synthase
MISRYSASVEIIAELGSVHDGSFGNALKLIDCAADSGATIAKFQLHIAEAETTKNAPSPSYFSLENRYDYFNRISFNKSQWLEIKEKCHSVNLKFGCSPFSLEAVDFLLDVGVDVLKIPSGEVTNHPLIACVAKANREVHISSGMSNWDEIDLAMKLLQEVDKLVLMQCTSLYPALPAQVGLNLISEMGKRYERKGLSIGFSDHSRGIAMPIAAVALGASAVEKHLTFSRKMYGSDAFNALEPGEFAEMCAGIKEVRESLNHPVDKNQLEVFNENRAIFQKSIYIRRSLKQGETLTLDKVKFLKPGTGISPSEWSLIEGKKATHDLPEGKILKSEDYQ